MNTIALDYETFYVRKQKKEDSYSIKHLGNWRYCNDEKFDAYLLSIFDGTSSWVGHPKDFNWDSLEDSLLLAHNAGFERAVTLRLVELGIAPPRMLRAEWQCTANMTSCLASTRSLEEAVLVLEGRQLDKGIREWMNGKRWADIVAGGKADEVAKYGQRDVQECHGLWTKYSHLWLPFERELSELTMKQCARGVCIDVDLLNKYRAVLQEVIFNLERSFPWVQRGEKPTSSKAIAEQCRMVKIPAPPVKEHDEEGFILWEKTYGPQYAWVYGAGQWRSLKKLLSTLETIKERLRPDNTIDFSLLYFGGHTGRWSGGGSGLNLQNLRKVPLFVKGGSMVVPPPEIINDDEALKAFGDTVDFVLDVRALLIPRPGKKFIIADLAQIEPRVLNWLAGNHDLLKLIAQGFSYYEAYARTFEGWTGEKGTLKKALGGKAYTRLKNKCLGLGYQMGPDRFVEYAGVTLEEAEQVVAGFREENPLLAGDKGLWRTLDNEFRASVGGDFTMELPSGRKMVYRNVRREVRSKKNPKTGKYEQRFVFTARVGTDKEEFYGGKLTENATQAAARDAFGCHLLTLEREIGDVIFHSHDEAITEVDMDVQVSEVEHVMSQSPEWMPGLPVAAEAKEANRYLK